ncbi:MAG: hypothetical protein ACIAS6_08575 [Phycisphaerales bacterium JB060]
MRQKQWLAIAGAAMVLTTGMALGLGNSSSADEPVRVYLVHGATAPTHGSSGWGTNEGITTYSVGGRGNVWATQALGYLEDIDEHWVVLRKVDSQDRKAEIHIPRERVQLIEELTEERFRAILNAR